jgi:hypothetical protein
MTCGFMFPPVYNALCGPAQIRTEIHVLVGVGLYPFELQGHISFIM